MSVELMDQVSNQSNQQNIPNVTENAVLLLFSVTNVSCSKRVKSEKILKPKEEAIQGIDPKPEVVKVNKQIFDLPSLAALRKFNSQTRNYIRSKCIKSFLQAGIFLLPNTYLVTFDDWYKQRYAEWELLRDQFLDEYENIVLTEAGQSALKESLGSKLYDPNDYPPSESFRQIFKMEKDYKGFHIPKVIESISQSIFEESKKQDEIKWMNVNREVQNLLRLEMLMCVEKMVDQMSPNPKDGSKPKGFKEAFINNVHILLNDFQHRNITNDKELADLVQRARDLMSGVGYDELKADKSLRDIVHDGFQEIKSTMDTMTIEKPARAIKLTGRL